MGRGAEMGGWGWIGEWSDGWKAGWEVDGRTCGWMNGPKRGKAGAGRVSARGGGRKNSQAMRHREGAGRAGGGRPGGEGRARGPSPASSAPHVAPSACLSFPCARACGPRLRDGRRSRVGAGWGAGGGARGGGAREEGPGAVPEPGPPRPGEAAGPGPRLRGGRRAAAPGAAEPQPRSQVSAEGRGPGAQVQRARGTRGGPARSCGRRGHPPRPPVPPWSHCHSGPRPSRTRSASAPVSGRWGRRPPPRSPGRRTLHVGALGQRSSPERAASLRSAAMGWAPSRAQGSVLGMLTSGALWARASAVCPGAARVTWIYLQWGYRGALKLEGPGPREHPATWVPEAASSGVTESVLVRQEVPGRFPRTGSPGPRAGATSSSFPLGQLHSSPAMSSPHSSARERRASWGRDRTPLRALASPKLPGSCPMTAPAPTVGLITHSVTPVPF